MWRVFCATTWPSRRNTTGTSVEPNPRAAITTSRVTWLRTKAKSSTATFSTARSLRACAPTGRAKTGALNRRSSGAAAGDEQSGQRAAAAASRGGGAEGSEDVRGSALRVGGKLPRIGRLQLLVEPVHVHLEPGGELREIVLVLRGPAAQLLRARGPRRTGGELHRSAGVEEQRDAGAHPALRAQLDARLEEQHQHQERRRQAKSEQRHPAHAGRVGAKAAEGEPHRGCQGSHGQREHPGRKRRERGDAPRVVRALRNLRSSAAS